MLSLRDSLPLRGEILLRREPLRISLPCLPRTLVHNLDAWCQEDFPISARTCIERPWHFFGDNTSRPGVWYNRIVVHLFPGRGAAFAYFLSYKLIIEFTLQVGIPSAQDIVSSRLFLKKCCVRMVRTCGLSVLLVYCISNHGSFLSIAGLINKQFPLQTLNFNLDLRW